MARIAGINIPEQKHIWVSLTYIYGISRAFSLKILKQADIKPNVKTADLSPEQVNKLKGIIENEYKVEGDLRRYVKQNIKRLKDIGSWRGLRHIKGLTVRGQTTRVNSRTVRGNVRKTMGSGRRPAASPT